MPGLHPSNTLVSTNIHTLSTCPSLFQNKPAHLSHSQHPTSSTQNMQPPNTARALHKEDCAQSHPRVQNLSVWGLQAYVSTSAAAVHCSAAAANRHHTHACGFNRCCRLQWPCVDSVPRDISVLSLFSRRVRPLIIAVIILSSSEARHLAFSDG